MYESEQLRRDLARLTSSLEFAIETLGGDHARELWQRFGNEAAALRRGQLARDEFGKHIAALSVDDLEALARAHGQQCHLLNTAEERERLRALHAKGDHTPDGLLAAIDALIDQSSADDIRKFFDHALVMPVITAHPTESRRRSFLDHLQRITTLLSDLGDHLRLSQLHESSAASSGQMPAAARDDSPASSGGLPASPEISMHQHTDFAALRAEVLALYATEDSRARRPSPLDEVETALEVFRRSLLDVTPRIYRTLEDRLEARFGGTWRLPCFLRWGSWVGGDRDGNPNVTAPITRNALSRQRGTALARYLADVELLGRTLSMSALRGKPGATDELMHSIEVDRERLPEVAAHARPRTINEPWREKLWYIQARLRGTIEHREDGYFDVARYRADLAVLDSSLRAAGFAAIADQDLRDALRRVDVFGFHLASLDLRQHSAIHDKAVAELLARAGHAGYLDADEAARRKLLTEVLAKPIPPTREREALSPETREVLATLDVAGRARRELGPRACERYVVSFTREVSDMLEVVFLARAAGLAPGELRPVPLLEQLEDLERAATIATDILAHPVLRTELGSELEVMLGYSDSGKQVGYVASSMALRRAQLALADVTSRANVTLTIFHGRGGALGRGGGPASDAIRAQPPSAIRGRLRVTEQGETVTARYTQPAIAERDLELTLAAVFNAALAERDPSSTDTTDEVPLQHAAAAARDAYLALTSDEDRLARYTLAATPIEDVGHLPIGSRPARRGGGLTLESLRAIPWVFSWTQSRHGIPGWFGVGTAVDALVAEIGLERTRSLCERSRFFRALVRNCEVSLVRSDIDVAREYSKLADPDARQLFNLIEAEHARTVHALRETLGMVPPLATRPYLAASVERRNPHLDVLSHVQIEALRRRRANEGDAEHMTRVIYTTIGGIAAGLQTAG